MMGRAYVYAAGGPQILETELLHYIDRFGAQNVYGRPLSIGELRRLNLYERVVNAYRARAKHPDGWAAWAGTHRSDAELLEMALLESENVEQS